MLYILHIIFHKFSGGGRPDRPSFLGWGYFKPSSPPNPLTDRAPLIGTPAHSALGPYSFDSIKIAVLAIVDTNMTVAAKCTLDLLDRFTQG